MEKKLHPSVNILSNGASDYLNLVRVIAVETVLIGHFLRMFQVYELSVYNIPQPQSLAVTVLFVLSGFLISYTTVIKQGTSKGGVGYYFADRSVRIYSVLIPSLLFTCIMDSILLAYHAEVYKYKGLNGTTFVANLFMLQNFPLFRTIEIFRKGSFGSNAVLWTMPIEWFLYIVFGVIFFKLYKRKRVSSIYGILLPFMLFCFIVPVYNLLGGTGNGLTFAWILGCGTFFAWNRIREWHTKTLPLLYIVIIILAAGRSIMVHRNFATAYDPLFSVFVALIILLGLFLMKNVKMPYFLAKILHIISGYSYSLFITHYTIAVFLLAFFFRKMNKILLFWLAIIFCNLFAYLFSLLFEKYLRKKIMALFK